MQKIIIATDSDAALEYDAKENDRLNSNEEEMMIP